MPATEKRYGLMPQEIRFSRLPSSLPNWWLSLPATGLFMHWTKTRFRPLEIQHGLPHCSLPYSSKRQCLYRQQQRKILLHPPGKRHAQLGYRRTERLHRVPPGYRSRTHLYRNLGSHVLCHRPENREKVWEFDTERGRYFSPGACWPTVLPYRKNGKASEQVIVLSSDYFVRAFNPEDGKILWASDEAKGRESIGFSPDGKTMYIKGIKNNITAADVSKGNYTPLWNTLMPYEGNFIPTRMETTEEYVFIPTEFGVVHAVRTDGSGIAWSHKVSHSAVTSLKKAGDHRLIVMTMDGTVTCLIYP